MQPTRATPGGCVLGLFGIVGWIYSGLSGWALYLALSAPPALRDPRLVWHLMLGIVLGLCLGTALVWLGWRLARKADMSDLNDPRKPMIRF